MKPRTDSSSRSKIPMIPLVCPAGSVKARLLGEAKIPVRVEALRVREESRIIVDRILLDCHNAVGGYVYVFVGYRCSRIVRSSDVGHWPDPHGFLDDGSNIWQVILVFEGWGTGCSNDFQQLLIRLFSDFGICREIQQCNVDSSRCRFGSSFYQTSMVA